MINSNTKVLAAVFIALALLAAACSADDAPTPAAPPVTEAVQVEAPGADEPPDAEQTTTTAPETTTTTTTPPATSTSAPATTAPTTTLPQSPPYRAELPSGAFILADRIAQKLTLDQTLSLVVSVVDSGEEGSGPALGAGFAAGAAETSERHSAGVEASVLSADGADQGAQIDDLVISGTADCLAVEVPDPADAAAAQSVATAIDRAVNSGVPVFTVNRDSDSSRRFAFYGLDPLAAGRRTGEAVGRWAVEGRILLRKAGVLAGDAQDPASRHLMEGFIAGITAQLPDIEFVNGPDAMESFGFDPVEFYDEAGEWILAHPDADIVFVADTGLEPASRFIAERALYGDVSLAGFDMSETISNYIREGVIVAAMLPGHTSQAAAAAEACGDFLLAGAYHTGAVAIDPVAVTEDNVTERDWTLPENR